MLYIVNSLVYYGFVTYNEELVMKLYVRCLFREYEFELSGNESPSDIVTRLLGGKLSTPPAVISVNVVINSLAKFGNSTWIPVVATHCFADGEQYGNEQVNAFVKIV